MATASVQTALHPLRSVQKPGCQSLEFVCLVSEVECDEVCEEYIEPRGVAGEVGAGTLTAGNAEINTIGSLFPPAN